MTTSFPPLPDADDLFVSLVSDVLDSIDLPNQVVDSTVRPLADDMRMYGRAVTLDVRAVDTPPEKPYDVLLQGITEAAEGSVLIAACSSDGSSSGLFGGLLATACQASGIVGTVTDGSVRDVAELKALGFPTFAAGINAADSYGRDEVVAKEVPVSLGRVSVRPGDVVFGDVDGVVVVPADRFDEVYDLATEKLAREGRMRDALADGMPLYEAFATFEVL